MCWERKMEDAQPIISTIRLHSSLLKLGYHDSLTEVLFPRPLSFFPLPDNFPGYPKKNMTTSIPRHQQAQKQRARKSAPLSA
jgi:hypothetical protein